jgi:adenylyltransferase/sulfurtransferase
VVKRLHGLESLAGSGFVFEGLGHKSYPIGYPINPDCPWHADPPVIEACEQFDCNTPMHELWQYGAERLGKLDALDLARELVASLACPSCGTVRPVSQPVDRITEEEAVCAKCRSECVPDFMHSLAADSDYLQRTPSQLGLPKWDIVWARHNEEVFGMELAGDRAVAPCAI